LSYESLGRLGRPGPRWNLVRSGHRRRLGREKSPRAPSANPPRVIGQTGRQGQVWGSRMVMSPNGAADIRIVDGRFTLHIEGPAPWLFDPCRQLISLGISPA